MVDIPWCKERNRIHHDVWWQNKSLHKNVPKRMILEAQHVIFELSNSKMMGAVVVGLSSIQQTMRFSTDHTRDMRESRAFRPGIINHLDYSSTMLLQSVPEMSVSMPLKTICGMLFEISNRLFLLPTKTWIILSTVPILEIRNLR